MTMQTGDGSNFHPDIELVETTDPGHADTFNPLFKLLIDNDTFLNVTKADLVFMEAELAKRVNKVEGKQLSTEDYTSAEKAKLSGIEAKANHYTHPNSHPASIIVEDNSRKFVTAEEKSKISKMDIVYTKDETDQRIQAVVGTAPESLNTLKEISVALNSDPDFASTIIKYLAAKVDKVEGKQLSTEDYSTADKVKLLGIEAEANNYSHPSTHPATMIVEDTSRRFASDSEKAAWNAKETPTGAQAKANTVQENLNSHVADAVKHITAAERDTWNAKETPAGAQSKASAVQASLNSHMGDAVKHITAAERTAWDAKETPAGAQSKAGAVQAGLNSHDADVVKHITAAERDTWNAKETPGGAQEKANKAEANAINFAKNSGLGEWLATRESPDSNTATLTGMYYAQPIDPNRPPGVLDGALFVLAHSEIWINQIYLDWRTNKTYRRVCTQGAWSAWQELETTADSQLKAIQTETNAKNYADAKFATKSEIGNAGYGHGDMLKSVYDKNGDGIVDVASSVPWTGVTDKPTTFPPSNHTHQSISYIDSRDVNFNPFSFTGLSLHIKENAVDGLNDGHPYHGVLHIAHWGEMSGGAPTQLAFSKNGSMYMRQYDGASWTAWRKLSFEGHTHTIANVAGLQGALDAKAPTEHVHDVLTTKPENFRDGLSLPSTYEIGQTIFFSNLSENRFNGVPYCTVVTTRGYGGHANCMQFIYPYLWDSPIYYRYSLYPEDSWKEWIEIETAAGAQAKANKAEENAINFAKNNGLGAYVSGRLVVDLNLTTINGIYYVNTTTANTPAANAGTLFVMSHDENWVTQLYLEWDTNRSYRRSRAYGAWSSWQELATTELVHNEVAKIANGTTDVGAAWTIKWRNYGDGHCIFDASGSVSPTGVPINNTNSEIAWTPTFPTLMGWNGTSTYGVRVESARVADTLGGKSASDFGQTSTSTYSGDDAANRIIELGFQPKYVKIIGNGQMFELYPTLSQITPQAQQLDGNNFTLNDGVNIGAVTATGFTLGSSTASKANTSGKTYTYIAFG